MLRKFALAAVIGFLPALAFAQPQAGNWELTLNGGGSNNKGFTAGSFNVGGGLGFYALKEVELSLRQTVSYADFNSGTTIAAGTRVAADYHFDLGQWQPFIGANIGCNYGEHVKNTWQAAPEAGLKFYVNKSTFVYGQAEYQFFFASNSGSNGFDKGQFVYSLGIGFLF